MSILIVPTHSNLPSYNFNVDLDENNFIFQFDYNGRADRWFMTLKDRDGNSILDGVMLETGIDYLDLIQNDEKPQGNLILENISDNDIICGRNDLGINFRLLYNEAL